MKPNYITADPEYLAYDAATLSKWTVNRNSGRNPYGPGYDWAQQAPTLSGSINLLGVGSNIKLDTYYVSLYRWYIGNMAQPLVTKLTMASNTKYHINCIGSVPSGDPEASRELGWKLDTSSTTGPIFHAWCVGPTESMAPSYEAYGATTKISVNQGSTLPGSTTVYVWPSANVVSGSVVVSTDALAMSISDAHVETWSGIGIPFVARAASFGVTCNWRTAYDALLSTDSWSGPGGAYGYSNAKAEIYLTIELYDVSGNNALVGSATTTVLNVLQSGGAPLGGPQVTHYTSSGAPWTVSLPVSAIAGHTYLVVTCVHTYIWTQAYASTGEAKLDMNTSPYQGELQSVVLSYPG
jgi:hypothetical protein